MESMKSRSQEEQTPKNPILQTKPTLYILYQLKKGKIYTKSTGNEKDNRNRFIIH